MILEKTEEPEKCPSCQLRLEDECEEHKGGTARHICHRINQHLVIPLLLLPVILLLLGIFRLVARPDQDVLLFKSTVVRRGLGGITALSARAEQRAEALKVADNLEEFEDRDLINGFKTSFVPLITNTLPLNMLTISHQSNRRRRQLKEIVWNISDMENISNDDVIEWAAVKPPIKNTGGKIGCPGERDMDHKEKTVINDTRAQNLFQDGETKQFDSTNNDGQTAGKQWSRKSFWDEDVDQENIRIAQARIMLSLMNNSVDPCADFYEYACGGWSNTYPIPKNRAGSGTIEILKSSIDEVVRRLLEYEETDEENFASDDVNIINNGNNNESPTADVKETWSRNNSSSELTQILIKINYADSPLTVSLLDNPGAKEQEKLVDDATLKEQNFQTNHGDQIENSSSLSSKLLDGQKLSKEEFNKLSMPMEEEDEFIEKSNFDNNNSHANNSKTLPTKPWNPTGNYLNFNAMLVNFNNENETKSVLTKNIPIESNQDPKSNFNLSSNGLGISLNDKDKISSLSESTSPPSSVISSPVEDHETKVSNIESLQRGNKEVVSVGGNAGMLDSVSKKVKRTKKMKDKSSDAIKKAKNFYKSCINTDLIEERAEVPLVELLNELGGWPKQKPPRISVQWTALAAKLRLYNNNILITEWVGPDIHNSEEYVIQLDKAGLGLPTRDYFLSESNTETVKAYHQFIMRVAVLLGVTPKEAEKIADQIVTFEIHLALITVPHEEKKNLTEFYSKMTVSELCEAIPGINWMQYLTIILNSTNPNFNLSSLNSTPVQVFDMQYFHDLAILLNKYHPRIIQSYMLWRFVSHRAGNLDQRFWDARSHLRKMLTGREEAPPRWESCVAHTTAAIGHAVGSLFVKQHFDEQSKSDTLLMTADIQAAFRQSLLDPDGATASWMDEETRSLAVDKADAMALRVGYPDLILDPDSLNDLYDDLKVEPELYFENTLAVLKYITQREHSLLGTEVDKMQWSAPLTEVNAFYSRKKNQIFLPAGILQPPFYHRHFPKSLNYGGIGVVIGHEMTHGFDNRGRLFDRHGNLQRWWQPTAIEAFQKRAECLVDQYTQYHVEEVSMQIDGTRTQSENIADNGGLKQAYKAYENWLRIHKDEQSKETEETLPGINASARQLFFLNFAQVWCGALRPEAIKNKLKTSIHSLEKFRVIGTLSNSEEFSEAFSCPSGSPMNPQLKCSVW